MEQMEGKKDQAQVESKNLDEELRKNKDNKRKGGGGQKMSILFMFHQTNGEHEDI